MSVKCHDCGATEKTAGMAYRKLWCRKSYVDGRPVQWACSDCTAAAVLRSRMSRTNPKRFNLHF
jgi:predicted RNA-binding Zn-ribbon protein involved in translation (DUF1610 family)